MCIVPEDVTSKPWSSVCLKLTINDNRKHHQFPAGSIEPNFNFWQVLLARMLGKPLYKDRVISYCGALADSQKRTPKGLVYIEDYGSLSKIAAAAYICFQVMGLTHYFISKYGFLKQIDWLIDCHQEYPITWVCKIVNLWLGYSDTIILKNNNLNKDRRKKFKFNNWIAEHSPSHTVTYRTNVSRIFHKMKNCAHEVSLSRNSPLCVYVSEFCIPFHKL